MAGSGSDIDSAHMRRALELAELGWGQTAPNPMVGAVVVAGASDTVVGEGYHARYGGPHAEVEALRAAGDRARGATLYVSLEPCAHFGKTPPCTDAIIEAGVARVVIATPDPSDIARGGADVLRAAGIAVDVGPERLAALELNAPFFNAHASDRPWVTLKLALSADGAIADPTGANRWITGETSRAYVHHLRAGSDGVAVGIGTVLADDPTLTVRDAPAPRVPPRRVVFDSSLRTPIGSSLIRNARETPITIVARPGARSTGGNAATALADAGVDLVDAGSLDEALVAVRSQGIRSLLVEGGARLAGALLRASLADRLIIFRSSVVMTLGWRARSRAFPVSAPARFRALARRSAHCRDAPDRRRPHDDFCTARGPVFTGLIEDVGVISAVATSDAGREFRVMCRYTALAEGESIAVNGACLTVREHGDGWFTVAAITTTLSRTTMDDWRVGRRVNLERALRAGDRFGGHFVQGHVDGVATVEDVRQSGDARLIDLALPSGLAELMVLHGSVTIDGVSLTVNELPPPETLQVSLIEYTLQHTTLADLATGDRVHVEADMLGKYVQRLLGEGQWASAR